MMLPIPIILPVLFLATALVYASVGFGGGSTYIALLLLFGFSHTLAPKVSLVCNLIVVAGGVYHFGAGGYLPWRRLAPFAVTSVPLAYVGGRLPVSRETFLFLAGLSLAAAALRLLWSAEEAAPRGPARSGRTWTIGVLAGTPLGLLSGIVGIGGGVFLSPLLYLLGWGTPREIAGLSSAFILVNSMSGLAGQLVKGPALVEMMTLIPLALAVLIGGQIGSRLGTHRLPAPILRRTTGVLVLAVALRILWGFL